MPTLILDHPAVDAVLSAAAELVGMELVFIGGLTEETFTFERVHARSEWPGVREGVVADRSDTLCHRLLTGAPAATSDARTDAAYRDVIALDTFGITSYVGVPVRDETGKVVATLCGIDHSSIEVHDDTIQTLEHLATVISAHLTPLATEGVVIRRGSSGGWEVAGEQICDLTSAMVLADLLAADLQPGGRPAKAADVQDELGRLRVSVTQLEHALAARVTVEQAIGVMTERQHSTPRDAFERLRRVSRSKGRKVHDLAREVVRSATDPAVPLPPELAGRR